MEEGMPARRCMASAPTDMPPYSMAAGITASGLSLASRATMMPTNPTPPLMPSIRRCCEPRTSTIPARRPARRQKMRPAPVAAHVDAGIARGGRVEAGHDQFVAQRHFPQQHPHQQRRQHRDQNARVRACPGQDKGQPRGARQQRGFRKASGGAHGAGDQVLQDENRDVIGHQRNQNFVAAEPRADQPNDAGPDPPAAKANKITRGKKTNNGSGPNAPPGAVQEPASGGRGADDEASFKAEVAEAGAPTDDRAQRDQRKGAARTSA